jgi:dihydropteroate synthase
MVKYFPSPEDDKEQQVNNKEFTKVHASKSDVVWNQDPKSYFTIMPYPKKGVIMVRVYSAKHEKVAIVDGKTPEHIYHKIISMGLITKMEHAAYLGKELYKAFLALQFHLQYVQDDSLDFNKKIKVDKTPKNDLSE